MPRVIHEYTRGCGRREEGEEDVPKQLRGKGVEAVRVIYDEEESDDTSTST